MTNNELTIENTDLIESWISNDPEILEGKWRVLDTIVDDDMKEQLVKELTSISIDESPDVVLIARKYLTHTVDLIVEGNCSHNISFIKNKGGELAMLLVDSESLFAGIIRLDYKNGEKFQGSIIEEIHFGSLEKVWDSLEFIPNIGLILGPSETYVGVY